MSAIRTLRTNRKGFTLVEILIVVIILGILAAIVIPQFTSASTDARKNSLTSQLQTVRSQIELYKLQHNDNLPDFANKVWEQMTAQTDVNGDTQAASGKDFGPYLQQAPVNSLNQKTGMVVVTADPANIATSTVTAGSGFVINTTNGKVWATNQDSQYYYDESTGTIK
ncbi:MAG: prepilin-type N-terminal cleavage/methylation domain-containing protein [Phycisphaerae bacterium]|nr:prepilin-type N-terminal cleavage/methylation domain-containing protein [Tepidisphaeraceae bacterium]